MLEPNTVPELVSRWQRGERDAFAQLYRVCDAKMRNIAVRLMVRESQGHTLQATALVHEMYLKLSRGALRVTSEIHFFNIAGRVMRRLLIDHARGKRAERQATVYGLLDNLSETARRDPSQEGVATQLVLERLREVDPDAARTVWLRVVEGFTIAETARLLGRPTAKVREDYDFAIKWMVGRLSK